MVAQGGSFWGQRGSRRALCTWRSLRATGQLAGNAAMMQELATWYGQGKIKPVIDSTMPMADLKAAYAHMGSRGVKGKLVMVN